MTTAATGRGNRHISWQKRGHVWVGDSRAQRFEVNQNELNDWDLYAVDNDGSRRLLEASYPSEWSAMAGALEYVETLAAGWLCLGVALLAMLAILGVVRHALG